MFVIVILFATILTIGSSDVADNTTKNNPFYVAIEIKDYGGVYKQKCSGALIHPKYVVTLQNCVSSFASRVEEDIRIQAGFTLKNNELTNGQLKLVKKAHNFQNDLKVQEQFLNLVVLELIEEFELNEKVNTINVFDSQTLPRNGVVFSEQKKTNNFITYNVKLNENNKKCEIDEIYAKRTICTDEAIKTPTIIGSPLTANGQLYGLFKIANFLKVPAFKDVIDSAVH